MTANQIKLFWMKFREACEAKELTLSLGKEAYRKRILREECGVSHLSEVSPVEGFRKVMMRLAIDAGNYEEAARYTGENDGVGKLIVDCTRQVFELAGKEGGEAEQRDYAIGIMLQSGLGQVRRNSATWWMDFAPDKPLKVFYILDSYRRKLHRKAHPERPLRFIYGQKY